MENFPYGYFAAGDINEVSAVLGQLLGLHGGTISASIGNGWRYAPINHGGWSNFIQGKNLVDLIHNMQLGLKPQLVPDFQPGDQFSFHNGNDEWYTIEGYSSCLAPRLFICNKDGHTYHFSTKTILSRMKRSRRPAFTEIPTKEI